MDRQTPQNSKKIHQIQIQPFSKIVLSALIAFIWFLLTKGSPPNRNVLQGLSHVDTTIEEIFETTIAVEKKRFTQRIISESEGVWSYIPYANQPRWIDIEIVLTTRIGFDVQDGEVSIGQNGRISVDVYKPTILSKTWSTEIVDKAETMFNKWDIREYKQREDQIIQAIAFAESQNLLAQFRNNPGKMSELAQRLDHKLEMKGSWFYRPMEFIDGLNRMVNHKVRQIGKMLGGRQVPEIYDEKAYPKQDKSIVQNRSTDSGPRKSQRKVGKTGIKKIASADYYTDQEKKIRNDMKDRYNL